MKIDYALDQALGIQPLFTAKIDGKDETVAWSFERADGGRAFGFVDSVKKKAKPAAPGR